MTSYRSHAEKHNEEVYRDYKKDRKVGEGAYAVVYLGKTELYSMVNGGGRTSWSAPKRIVLAIRLLTFLSTQHRHSNFDQEDCGYQKDQDWTVQGWVGYECYSRSQDSPGTATPQRCGGIEIAGGSPMYAETSSRGRHRRINSRGTFFF